MASSVEEVIEKLINIFEGGKLKWTSVHFKLQLIVVVRPPITEIFYQL